MNFSAILMLFLVKSSFCFRLEDLLPIKYDVVRVRSEREARLMGNKKFTVIDFIGLVERHRGYRAEEHKLTTSDGYVLVLHRITASPRSPSAPGKPVVFLKHGLTLSSDDLVLIGPGRDLAFLLADAGYDVWLGNARGNTYSRSHVHLSPKEKKFWEFSYHEIGTIDMRSSIDRVLEITGKERLIFIGYSMGTTESYVLLSMFPEYNEKISLCISLAPIAFFRSKMPFPVEMIAKNMKNIQRFSEKYRYYEIMPQSSFIGNFAKTMCSDKTKRMQQLTCTAFFKVVAPVTDLTRFNTSAYPIIFSHFPAGASLQCFVHYAQNILSKNFQMFNYGPQLNYIKYGSIDPPMYNLTRVTTPVAIFYGDNDYFAPVKDVEYLCKTLPNAFCKKIPQKNFNHLDILWAKDSKEVLYDLLIPLIEKYRDY